MKLQQTLGTALMPAMTKITESITKILTPLVEWAEKHPDLTAAIILTTTAILGLTAALVTIGLIIGPLTAAFTAL